MPYGGTVTVSEANPINLASSDLWRYIRSPLGGIVALSILFTIVLLTSFFAPLSNWMKDALIGAYVVWMFYAVRHIVVNTPKGEGGLVFSEQGYVMKHAIDSAYGTKEHIATRSEAQNAPKSESVVALPDEAPLPSGRPRA